jgi:diguanylate cyclase (GGDEF)-like protein
MEKKDVKVLLVDDDQDDYIITRDLLSEVEGETYSLEWASNYDQAMKLINKNCHDVYLFDYRLGERSGLDLLRETIATGCNAPIILLTGQGDHELDMRAMEAGAADYLAKGEITKNILDRSIRYSIRQKKSEDRILRMAYYDSLTDLPNRLLFHDRLKQALNHAERYKSRLSILFLDLDNFKRINDTLEHRIGDLLLKGFAGRLLNYVRTSDTVSRLGTNEPINTIARLGGDEFTILLVEVSAANDISKIAQRVLKILAQPFALDGHEVFITGSIGIAIYPDDGTDADSLLKNADIAMYHAKEQGKNNFQFYNQSMNATAYERLSLENNLRRAMDREDFVLYYQPRMEIRTGEIVGTEALVRWDNPDKGMLQPADFIPLAEETGLIVPMGEWILDAACKQNKTWQQEGSSLARVAVSVNLSGKQFKQTSLLEVVENVLVNTELDPNCLELELTESVLMDDEEKTLNMLHRLKRMGVVLSIDDFGTGYSSFSYLKLFPIDILKIDRSFIKDATTSTDDATIVEAIIAMAHSLNLRVVAEGVETEEQLAFLREIDCDEAQGFWLCPPLQPDEVLKFLNNREKQKD